MKPQAPAASPAERVQSHASHDKDPDGETGVSIRGQAAPRLPHEHDESSHSQASEPREVMKQAHADIERGLVDTDRGKPMNETYRRLKSGAKQHG